MAQISVELNRKNQNSTHISYLNPNRLTQHGPSLARTLYSLTCANICYYLVPPRAHTHPIIHDH